MRLPSRLTSTICGPPLRGWPGLAGCAVRLTIPPNRIELTFFGLNGSLTSYWMNSPEPQHETYRYRSSTERLMSLTRGGSALKPCNSGGSLAGSAGVAGISITFLISHFEPSRYHSQIEDERSFSEITTPRKPYALVG